MYARPSRQPKVPNSDTDRFASGADVPPLETEEWADWEDVLRRMESLQDGRREVRGEPLGCWEELAKWVAAD